MAQTIGAMSFKDASLEFSLNGTTWTPHGGTFSAIDVGGGEVPTEDTHNADTGAPIVTEGKPDSFELTITNIYTEIAGEAQSLIETAYTARSALYVRWTAKGAVAPNKVFTSGAGKVTTPPYPKGDVGAAAAVLSEWKLITPTVTPGVYV